MRGYTSKGSVASWKININISRKCISISKKQQLMRPVEHHGLTDLICFMLNKSEKQSFAIIFQEIFFGEQLNFHRLNKMWSSLLLGFQRKLLGLSLVSLWSLSINGLQKVKQVQNIKSTNFLVPFWFSNFSKISLTLLLWLMKNFILSNTVIPISKRYINTIFQINIY